MPLALYQEKCQDFTVAHTDVFQQINPILENISSIDGYGHFWKYQPKTLNGWEAVRLAASPIEL